MTGTQAIVSLIERIPENKLIFANKLYEEQLCGQVTEGVYYQTLDRLCKSGVLCRIGRGTYYRPQKGKYGLIPLPESEIISAFTEKGTGAVVGYAMYNKLKLTTQVPKVVEVFSAKVEQQTKSIGNVLLRLCGLEYTPEVTSALCMLEVLQNFEEIQELNYYQFLCLCKRFAAQYSEAAVQQVVAVRQYKKKTLAFLKGLLEYYGVPNDISKNLSALSEYKHPSMEEIYEAAHLQCKKGKTCSSKILTHLSNT